MDISDAKWHNSNGGVAQKLGGQILGASSLVCSIADIQSAPKDQRPGKIVALGGGVVKVVKDNLATGTLIGGLVSTYGLSTAFAGALVKVVGTTVVQSVPSLNEEYSKGGSQVYENMANKVLGGK